MKGLREKFRNQKGFTLIEMLIVVAIIAILVAVSIPLVSNSLEKTRVATDRANERAAKAEAVIKYLDADNTITYTGGTATFLYDANKGSLEAVGTTGITGYGQCTTAHTAAEGHNVTDGCNKKIIQVTIAEATGEVSIKWVSAT